MNLVRVKEGPKDKKPHGNDANDEAAAGRAQTAFGPFRGIRPADVAVAQGYRLCGKQPLPFPPKG